MSIAYDDYFKHIKVVGKIMKDFINFQYPDLKIQSFIPGQTYILPNTDTLQIVFQRKSTKDLSNINYINNNTLPQEILEKKTLERYAVNFISYTNKKDGTNIAHAIAPIITMCFTTQRGMYELQKAKMKISLIGDCTDVSSVEGADNLCRIVLDMNIEIFNTFNGIAEYYDHFQEKPIYNISI
jgi:hypothetical protein